ncbi:hypothetical protein TrCOL_g4769 [Triparma columacea]|uniref:Adenosine deaminase domain-containing protein n=1 Tax=Triparma columacea TaxID=722753 RepID=A0A9W7LF26_9STRA|nr:hypothetical protein TrCOL_g4769 [Triparma columacea]
MDIPKVELHSHLNGSIRNSTLKDLLTNLSVPIPRTLQNPELEESTRTLSECFEIFPLIHLAVSTSSALRRVVRETLSDFESDNVIYLELRTTPRTLDSGSVGKREYVDLVLSEMKKWVEDKGTRLIPRLIISIDRSRGVEEARENMDIAKELFKMGHDYVVGVDLGGNPTKGTFKEFKGLLEEVRTAGMKVTVHAGEVDNLEEVNDIVAFRPDRLGHFLCVDDGVWEKMEREGGDIPIEVCPTSNVMTLGLEGLGQHPILERLVKEGYPVSINTDDAGVFNTKQSLELYRVAETLGLNEYTVSGLVWGAVDLVFEGNRRTRARVARDVMKGIKGILDKLERQEQGGT